MHVMMPYRASTVFWGEAANVDGCRDVFMVDPLVPTQACPAPEMAVPLTQEAVDDQAPPAKRLRREKDLCRDDFSSNVPLAKNIIILLYLLKSAASRVTVRVPGSRCTDRNRDLV